MRGDQRPAAVDNCFPVGLERVSRVVERDAEQSAYKKIGNAVQHQLKQRIIDGSPAACHESASEYTFPPLFYHLPVAHHISTVVTLISHHNDHSIAGYLVEPMANRPTEPVRTPILRRPNLGNPCPQVLQDIPGSIGATIVYHHDLVRDTVQSQLQMEVLHCGCNASLFVARRNHDGELCQR